jgi:chromosome condensin MukBEF complex kleisin-like MukF subunit
MEMTAMMYVRNIMSLLKIDEDEAFEVFKHMVIDFSECTRAEFIREAKRAYGDLVRTRHMNRLADR